MQTTPHHLTIMDGLCVASPECKMSSKLVRELEGALPVLYKAVGPTIGLPPPNWHALDCITTANLG